MKRRIICALLAALPFFAALASHAAESEFGGTITLELSALDENDQSAKFQEYRDLRDGVTADVDLLLLKGSSYLEVSGRNIGLGDQSLTLGGGSYDSFKYTLFFTEIPHNYSFGARTFYSGAGTADLDYAAPDRAKGTDAQLRPTVGSDTNLWNTFDYGIVRKQYGGVAEVSAKSPFFVKIGAKREERTGSKPLGADSGVFADIIGNQGSSFGNVVEMPEPVDYLTSTATVEAGYRSKPMVLTFMGLLSSFDNDNQTLDWRNPYVTTERLIETNYLAPENEYWRVGGQGVFRLPAHSTFSLRASYARLTDDLNLGTAVADSKAAPAGGLNATNSPDYFTTTLGVNRKKFKGEIDYTSARASLDTGALQPLTLNVQYDYTGRKNHSSTVEYTNFATGDSVESERLEYYANHASLDLGMKLSPRTKLDLLYDFRDTRREDRDDATSTTDHSVSLRLRNSSFERLTTRLQYQHLFRSSDAEEMIPSPSLTQDSSIELFVRRFDIADKDRDRAGVQFDLAVTENLDISLEYAYSRDDYDETTLGRLEDQRHEAFADLSYELPRGVLLGASAGYERVVTDQAQRQYNPGDITDPAAGNSRTAFNWTESLESDLWSYGLFAKVPVLPNKLDFAASWSYQKSDGEGLFTSSRTPLLDLNDSDNYKLQALEFKAIWKAARQLELVLGYRYEKFEESDTQWDGYVSVSRTSFLTGAYADEDYNVHIGYLLTRFTF